MNRPNYYTYKTAIHGTIVLKFAKITKFNYIKRLNICVFLVFIKIWSTFAR